MGFKNQSCKLLLEHPSIDVNIKHTFNFYLICSITNAENVLNIVHPWFEMIIQHLILSSFAYC